MKKTAQNLIIGATAVLVLGSLGGLFAAATGTASAQAKPAASVAAQPTGCTPGNFTVVEKSSRFEGTRIYVTARVRNDGADACTAKLQVLIRDKAGAIIGATEDYIKTQPGATVTANMRVPGDLTKAGGTGSYEVEVAEAYRAR